MSPATTRAQQSIQAEDVSATTNTMANASADEDTSSVSSQGYITTPTSFNPLADVPASHYPKIKAHRSSDLKFNSEKLNSDNYAAWERQMTATLRGLTWLPFITSPQYQSFELLQSIDPALTLIATQCTLFIQTTVSNILLPHVDVAAHPFVVWSTLKSQFSDPGQLPIVSAYGELAALKFRSGADLNIFLNEFAVIRNKLINVGFPPATDEYFMAVSLANAVQGSVSESAFTNQVNTHDVRKFTFTRVFSILQAIARSRRASQQTTQALLTTTKTTKTDSTNNRSQLICTCCKKTGHTETRCFFKHPELRPPWFKNPEIAANTDPDTNNNTKPSKIQGNSAQLVSTPTPADTSWTYAFAANTYGKFLPFSSWLLDSGCTQHMTSDRNVFTTYDSASTVVSFPNSTTITAIGIGTIRLLFNSNTAVEIPGVLHVPDLAANLLSANQLSTLGFHITLGSDTLVLTKDNITIHGRAQDGIYLLTPSSKVSQI
jgi:hypothetical protein